MKTSTKMFPLLLLLALPAVVQAQFSYTNINGTITITGYTGPGGAVTIPDTINGLPVSSIGDGAFSYCTGLASVMIGNGVIGDFAFEGCNSLTNVTIGNCVSSIGDEAFDWCYRLGGAYFEGNAPSLGGSSVFASDDNATIYYLPGTTGWGTTFSGRPTAPWYLPNPVILDFGPSFGVQTNHFGFIISWATNVAVVVEASTNLANPTWSPVATNTLTSGSSYFSDPQWTNYPARFYRLRSP